LLFSFNDRNYIKIHNDKPFGSEGCSEIKTTVIDQIFFVMVGQRTERLVMHFIKTSPRLRRKSYHTNAFSTKKNDDIHKDDT